MDYHKIYNSLILRAKNRSLEIYTESHHVVPRCMGGSDHPDNLVDLTPEEHYVAHQLLVKIYPSEKKLIKAAQMMIPNRPTNKLYGWLRRRFSEVQSESQKGSGNSQHGTRWIHNVEEKVSKKIIKDQPLPNGWAEGRRIGNWETTRKCKQCGTIFKFDNLEKYCSSSCKEKSRNPFYGRETEFLTNYYKLGSMNKALKEMGFPGAISHWYIWAKKILDERV